MGTENPGTSWALGHQEEMVPRAGTLLSPPCAEAVGHSIPHSSLQTLPQIVLIPPLHYQLKVSFLKTDFLSVCRKKYLIFSQNMQSSVPKARHFH